MPKAPAPKPDPYLGPDGRVLTAQPEYHAGRHPDFLEACARLVEIQIQLNGVGRQIDEEHTRLWAQRSTSRQLAKAHALVDGGPEPPETAASELADLYERQTVLGLAVTLAQKKRDEVAVRVSREICPALVPVYLELNRRLYSALREFAELLKADRDFLYELEAGGTRLIGIGQLGVTGVDPEHLLDVLAREAKDFYQVDLTDTARPGQGPAAG